MTTRIPNSSGPADEPRTSAPSPFHVGEQHLQTRAGVRDKIEQVGRNVIRDYLPAQHVAFYASLPFLYVGSVDRSGRPWASLLTGTPGFAHAVDERLLQIDTLPRPDDALYANLQAGAPLGLLGIEYHTRRRNRLAGTVNQLATEGFRVAVSQTFGNCPMYIQAREYSAPATADARPVQREAELLQHFDAAAIALMQTADNFYIASHHLTGTPGNAHDNVDVSHRGGRPGFVRVDTDRRLSFPDFRGNRHFNTLGNIAVNGLAGLLFIDFSSGDALQLTGTAQIDDSSAEVTQVAGAERLVHFRLQEGRWLRGLVRGHWRFVDYARQLQRTGTWPDGGKRDA